MNSNASFGYWVRRRRKALDLTQDELAKQVGCALSTIRKIEADERRPSREFAERLAGLLAIPAAERGAFLLAARAEAAVDQLADPVADVGHAAPEPSTRPQLPATPTPLVGRAADLARVGALLGRAGVRLLTLSGPGGVGKTRLSLAVAEAQAGAFADGAWFVALAPVRDPQLVPATIAQALGLREAGDQPIAASVLAHLRERRALLVLDNFEHVLAARSFVAQLLAGAPRLKLLVTSRAVLHLSGEHELPVPPLALPPAQGLARGVGAQPAGPAAFGEYAAVELFVQRAQAANPRFNTGPASLAAVAAICARLDGLPLAIELAAARCKLFGAPALLARLEQRLGLLSGGAHDLPARHQSLRDTIEWSFELLGAHEQALFRRLGVFAGCTLDAASNIVSFEFDDLNDRTSQLKPQTSELNTLAGLSALVDQSLLQQSEGPDGEPRFWLLETIREYALEQLARAGEDPAVRERHARFFLALAERAEPELTGARQGEWLDQLEREHDNLRAALGWAIQAKQAELAARMAGALWRFWATRGNLSEGRQWPNKILLDSNPISPVSRAKLLHAAGGLALWQSDYAAARSCFEQSVAIRRDLHDKAGVSMGLVGLAVADKEQGHYEKAQQYLEESLPLLRAVGDTWGTAAALNNLGVLANSQKQYQRAQTFHEESLSLRRQLGNTEGMAISLCNLGMVAYAQGDNVRARSLFLESQNLLLKLNDQRGLANIYANLGNVDRNQGDYPQAIAHYLESINISQTIGERRNITECLVELADTLQRQAHGIYSAHLYGLAEVLREQIGTTVEPAEQSAYDQSIDTLRAQLGEQAFAEAWAAGRALTLEQAIAEALHASE